MLLFIFKICFKKVDWCWKRVKSFMFIVVQIGACLDCGLDLCMSCLCYFNYMLSSFCCSITCPKWLRLLNMPLKESCDVFIIWEHIIVVFSFDALFGLTWSMLTSCFTLTRCLKPLWSFGFWLVIPLYDLVNNVLSLCMIMAIIALLVGRSKSFGSLHLYWEGILLVHLTTNNQVIPKSPL
jgi:hypothetical protein